MGYFLESTLKTSRQHINVLY